MLNSQKIMKIMTTLNFETPLAAKSGPPIKKKNLPPCVKLLFGKSP